MQKPGHLWGNMWKNKTERVNKMNDIIEKARELGQMIAESDEIKALRGAEELQLSDPAAQELMMEYANTREAAAAKAQMNLELDKKKMQLSDPIKALGTYEIPVKLHQKVTAKLTVQVVEG